MSHFGDYDTTETVVIPFNTFTSDDPSASSTITNLANTDIHIHKDGGLTQRSSSAGVTVSVDFDSITGNHLCTIDLSDNTDAGFYAAGSRYQVRMEGTTVDGATINAWIGTFSIGCTLRPTTNGRTLDVASTGEAGVDFGNVTGTLTQANVGWVDANSRVDVGSWLGNAVTYSAAAGPDVNVQAIDDIDAPATWQATIADVVWDEVITGAQHNVNNSAAKFLRESSEAATGVTGTAQGSGTGNNQIQLASGAVATNDLYNNERITIIEGTGAGQSRLIQDSVAASDTLTLYTDWITLPSTDSVYAISGAEADVAAIQGQAASATAAVDFDDLAAILTDTAEIGAAGAGLTAVPWNSAWDAEVQSEATDALNAYDPPTKTEMDSAFTEIKGGTWSSSTDTLEAIRNKETDIETDTQAIETDTQDIQSRLPSALVSGKMDSDMTAISGDTTAADNLEESATGIQTASVNDASATTTSFVTDLTEATDDHFNGRIIVFTTGALKNQATDITDYDGGTKTATVTALTEAPGNGDAFVIL